jgi:transposase
MKFKLNEEDEILVNKLLKKSKEEFRLVILLLLNNTDLNQKKIAKILDVTPKTVSKIKKRYLDEGLESAVTDRPRSGQPKKYEVNQETEIIALACTNPPEGRKRWTLRLLEETLREKEGFESVTRETVRIVLKKAQLNLGSKKCGA